MPIPWRELQEPERSWEQGCWQLEVKVGALITCAMVIRTQKLHAETHRHSATLAKAFISFSLESCKHLLTGLLMCLLSPFQYPLCAPAKLIFLKHGSYPSLPCSEPSNGPLSAELSDVSVYHFPVTLCAVLLHLSGILVTVRNDYSPEHIFVLAHILGFIWEDTNFTSLFQRVPTVIQGNETPLCGLSSHIPPFWTFTTWFPSLLWHLLGSNFVYLYTI